MFVRKKKYNKDIENKDLIEICEVLLSYNNDTYFGFSRRYTVENNILNEHMEKIPVILVNKPVDEVLVPSPYQKVNDNAISYWYDLKHHIATLKYVPMVFRSGIAHERQYLYTDSEEIDLLEKKELREEKRLMYK